MTISRHVLTAFCGALCLATALPAAALNAERLAEAAAEQLTGRALAAYGDADVSVRLVTLPTAQLARRCDTFKLTPSGSAVHGRVPLRVDCTGPAWSFYVSAEVTLAVPQVVAKTLLPRGVRLTRQHVALQTLPLPRQPVFTRLEDVLGKLAKRPIAAGTALRSQQLATPWDVERGQDVQLTANVGKANISTRGKALQNGRVGEQIRVENAASRKVVRAWVWSTGRVATRPPPL